MVLPASQNLSELRPRHLVRRRAAFAGEPLFENADLDGVLDGDALDRYPDRVHAFGDLARPLGPRMVCRPLATAS